MFPGRRDRRVKRNGRLKGIYRGGQRLTRRAKLSVRMHNKLTDHQSHQECLVVSEGAQSRSLGEAAPCRPLSSEILTDRQPLRSTATSTLRLPLLQTVCSWPLNEDGRETCAG